MFTQKKVIQVGGTVRSGTTIVGLILANQDKAISLGEVFHLFYPSKKIYSDKVLELKHNDQWKNILKDCPKNLYYNIFKNFPEINLIIDSSKDPFWFKETIGNNCTDYLVQQVLTFKSPSSLRESFEKRNFNNWKKVYLNYYKRFYTIFPDTPTIFLDSFLKDGDYLKKVCKHFQIDYYEDKMKYWEKNHPNFFGSTTVHQKKIDNKALDSITAKGTESDVKTDNLFQYLLKKQIGNIETIEENFKYNNLMIRLLYLKDYLFPNKLWKR